jgi:hypothetical protein
MLVLASTVILRAGFRGTHDHTFLFSFHYILSIVSDTNRIENTSSYSSSVVVYVATVWCFLTCCLMMASYGRNML